MFRFITLATLLLRPLITAAENGGLSAHIIGGSEVKPHSHPHQVLLNILSKTGEKNQCGGSLITSLWILSAAHCVYDVEYIFAIVGAHNIQRYEPSQQMKLVEQYIPSPFYNPSNGDNDIALLKLQSSVTLSDYVKPIRLPSQKNNWFWRYAVTITGWGKTSYEESADYSSVLQSIETKVITNFYCQWRIGYSRIKHFHICVDSSGGEIAAFQGDDGGPLVTDLDGQITLIGIHSIGINSTEDRTIPTVFTRVTNYLEWISRTTAISK